MIIGLFIGLVLMIVGTIMGCLCGMIKEVPRAVLLSFAVIFVYIVALSVNISEAGAIFMTSIPFIEQIKDFNAIVQQIICNVGDWTSIYQVLSRQFVLMNFFDEAIKLWIFSFESIFINLLTLFKSEF